MAVGPFQLTKSEIFRPVDDPTGTTYWMYLGDAEDDAAAQLAFDAGLPGFYLGSPQLDYRATHMGNGVYLAEVHYGLAPPLSIGETVWEIDNSAGREKIYQSKSTVRRQRAHTGDPLIDFGGAIGVTDEGVEGVEIFVGGGKMTAKRRYIQGDFASNYVEQVEQLLCNPPRTNDAEFSFIWQGQTYTFAAGELLMVGIHGSTVDLQRVEVDHEFMISRNRTDIPLQGFDATVSKNGHEAYWISFQKTVSNGRMSKRPIQYNAEQVYDAGDFSILQI